MKTVTINLGSIDKVKSFVNDITKFDIVIKKQVMKSYHSRIRQTFIL